METPTQKDIDDVINAYDRAEEAADFAEALVMEPQLIVGNRYKYIMDTEH